MPSPGQISFLRSVVGACLVAIILPLSPLIKLFDYIRMTRSAQRCFTNWKKHAKKVEDVQRQVREWIARGRKKPMCTARPAWQSFSIYKIDKKGYFKVEMDLNDVIEIDVKNKVVTVEPGVMMGQLSQILTNLGFVIPVIPEVDTLTVGGLICGAGLETSSHQYGIFADTVTSFEMVTADGDIVKCSKTENLDLFNAMPGSYGTIGFLTAVTIPLIPAGEYMKIEYVHVTSVPAAIKLMRERNNNHGYAEGIMYSMTDIMLMFGDTTDNPPKSQINYINRWYKPFFHNIVENVMEKLKTDKKTSSSTPYVEYFPLRDYFHRHSRGMFWEAENQMPLLSNRILLFFFGWVHPINSQLLSRCFPHFLMKFLIKDKVLQDFCVPMEKLDEFLSKLDTIFQIYPIWWCPTKVSNDSMWKTPEIYGADYMDLGIYGTAISSKRTIAERTAECEKYCLDNNGFNGLYAEVFLNKEELRKMYDTTAYDKVRKASSNCRKAFPDVFDKVLRKIK